MNCIYCGRKLRKPKTKFCSLHCNNHWQYQNNKQYFKNKAIRWQKENPEKTKLMFKKGIYKFRTQNRKRFNELARNNYYKNKDKWFSRRRTFYIIATINPSIDRFCKICKKKDNLEIHHEVYPIEKEDILKAIKDKKIYFLCRYHHKSKY